MCWHASKSCTAHSQRSGHWKSLQASAACACRYLNVSDNGLTGALPELPATLVSFDVSYNSLTGGLPQDMSHMSSLVDIQVGRHQVHHTGVNNAHSEAVSTATVSAPPLPSCDESLAVPATHAMYRPRTHAWMHGWPRAHHPATANTRCCRCRVTPSWAAHCQGACHQGWCSCLQPAMACLGACPSCQTVSGTSAWQQTSWRGGCQTARPQRAYGL